MKKFLFWLCKLAVVLALVFAFLRFGPALRQWIFGGAPVAVTSTELSREIKDMGVLVTLEQTEKGELTSSLSGFLGEWQRVTAPYEYSIQFGVDMQEAVISQQDGAYAVALPPAQVASQRFALTGDATVKDAAYPLTEKRMQEIQEKQRLALEEKYAADAELLQKAWDNAAARVQALVGELSGGQSVTVTLQAP